MKYYTPLIASLLLACSAAQAADPIVEQENNHPIQSSQRPDTSSGSAIISAFVGNKGDTGTTDVDYYTFSATAGDVVKLDIDGGYGGIQNVDTILGIFDSSGTLLRVEDDTADVDEGSYSTFDARIDNFSVPATGSYTVVVSSYPHYPLYGGAGDVTDAAAAGEAGDYALVISGITPTAAPTATVAAPVVTTTEAAVSVQYIHIDIKPGSKVVTPINPKAKGQIPVALLSSNNFDPKAIDTASLTFGSTGNENSLVKCLPDAKDLNKDGRADLVCLFENQQAGFVPGDLEGTLRGKLNGGASFEGTSVLKTVPQKKQRS